jgi:hypothetical protein
MASTTQAEEETYDYILHLLSTTSNLTKELEEMQAWASHLEGKLATWRSVEEGEYPLRETYCRECDQDFTKSAPLCKECDLVEAVCISCCPFPHLHRAKRVKV